MKSFFEIQAHTVYFCAMINNNYELRIKNYELLSFT